MTANRKVVESSKVFSDCTAEHHDVEVWPDDYFEEGWEYFSIVSHLPPTTRKLQYVRVKDGTMQRRTYDDNGDDLWLPAE